MSHDPAPAAAHGDHGGHGEKKGEAPKHIQTYFDNLDKKEKILNTFDHHHQTAYNKAVDKHLKDKDGNIDYKLLKKTKAQGQFADTLAKSLLEEAVKQFDYKGKDEFKKDMLLSAYHGVTRQELRGIVSEYGDKFTYDAFANVKNKIKKNVESKLTSTVGAHLGDEHIDDIIKHVGVGDYVERSLVTRESALSMLDLSKQYGGKLTQKLVIDNFPDHVLKEKHRVNYEAKH